jgi:outer membrane receptor protein involved in Fe transport
VKLAYLNTASIATLLLFAAAANAETFNIPSGDLKSALDAYARQTGVNLIVAGAEVDGVQTRGAQGDFSTDGALSRLLTGTGFSMHRRASGAIGIMREQSSSADQVNDAAMQLAQASPVAKSSVETVTVTSSKLGGADVQSIPIAITALSQEQLTATQTAGGPDLVKQVPNLTFTKTNFTGYNIQIRGIGTQAISVTTDPAVAVAFNDTPFIRNHFFEQEFYDVSQAEVLRGPQGTLYGRNATAGVVNLVSAKPTDQYEAMASIDVGNYQNRRLEGMLNVPIMGDKLGIRVAGEWTKRDGYSFNETTDKPVDGRDLWSSRVTIGFHPSERLQAYAVWEHFSEDDDRMRTAKQLCKKDAGPTSVDGLDITNLPTPGTSNLTSASNFYRSWLSQGCLPTSFYSGDAYETPNGQALPFVAADEFLFNGLGGSGPGGYMLNQIDPYSSRVQSRDLRVIQSDLSPTYKAKNDVFELNADFAVTPELKLTSQTGYNKDELRSTEDFNRFNTASGLFSNTVGDPSLDGFYKPSIAPNGVYCDPQLGCSSKMVGEDLSQERAWQFSQEIRLASSFTGPVNFSIGGNYMHYQTTEDYYVFFNLISATIQLVNRQEPGEFLTYHTGNPAGPFDNPSVILPAPFYVDLGNGPAAFPSNFGGGFTRPDGTPVGTYVDPNPITSLDGQGHNYFRSQNPYRLNSLAGFGEVYYQVSPEVKLTGGLRWTDDSKTFFNIPSWVFLWGGGYPVQSVVRQEWREVTGRFVANWSPKLDFTDTTLLYASYSRGYKGGGANPPGPAASYFSGQSFATHPATFAPEFVNAFELGTKNTLLDGSMTLNGDMFYYDYKGYQISQIVDRTSINLNFDAKVGGAEVEATWEPLPGLRLNLTGGYENSSVGKGQSAIDLIDRTAGSSDWMVVKPYLADTSNCILPSYVVRAIIELKSGFGAIANPVVLACEYAYSDYVYGSFPGHADPVTQQQYVASPTVFDSDGNQISYAGFDPRTAPNNGEGFAKDLSGNRLPNTPPFTLSAGAQYSMPISESWAGTLRGDFYWQGNSFARIFNDKPYDQLQGYTNVNLALIFTNQDGWQAMLYAKNVFDTTAITGAFLNSDDTALTTNVFTTDPRLFGIRITKNW